MLQYELVRRLVDVWRKAIYELSDVSMDEDMSREGICNNRLRDPRVRASEPQDLDD